MEIIEGYNYTSVSKLFEERGIKTLPTHIPFKVIDDAILILRFEDFMSFLDDNQIQQVFIHELEVEPEEYKITDDTFRKLGVSISTLEYLEKEIEEYNAIIDTTEFGIPEMVFALFIWQGQRFYCVFQNEIYIDDEELLSAEDKLAEMFMTNEKNIVEANESKRLLIEKQQNELRLTIINDPKFKECTNNRMRRNYIIEILKGDSVSKELKGAWLNCNGIPYPIVYDFIESIWREVKGK